jgi:carbon starvation protein
MFANLFYQTVTSNDGSAITLWKAMPIMVGVLCVLAIAYRYYSAFLAARVAALDDSRETPAHRFEDGNNYHPTNRWVLFGHHFAAISGAGPLIGPVLAIQYGYFPGLLWLVIGVCLAGAVQDMLVLAASVRRGGKSLAEIARTELGPWANAIVSAAILFIVVIALAGLGFVVVKALGGEEIKLAEGTTLFLPEGETPSKVRDGGKSMLYEFPPGCKIKFSAGSNPVDRPEAVRIEAPAELTPQDGKVTLPRGCVQVVDGSAWGTFTIACTVPIAIFVGLYMYRIRKGKVLEASLLGAAGVLLATVAGKWVADSAFRSAFLLSRDQTLLALTGYGFIASVLPVWLLLCPRDYLSSFLKIGTIILLIVGVMLANPVLKHPPINEVYEGGGPTFSGNIFPFVFICIMCGSISGFHSLVSSGTTPKMIDRESDVRTIGYGAMLIEGLVGVVALVAAASLHLDLYFDINTDLRRASEQKLQDQFAEAKGKYGMQSAAVDEPKHLDIAQVESMVGNESLRGRTGGAVTLAVGMALIFTDALENLGMHVEGVMAYWYHFAIMFEALFILTTIDTGTRIARFLLQEAGGRIYKPFEKVDWLPGAIVSTLIVTAGWGLLVRGGTIDTIWPMFGIANQLLAVVALCLITTMLFNSGKARYAPVTLLPMLFVTVTTMTAGVITMRGFWAKMSNEELTKSERLTGGLNFALTLFVMACVATLLVMAASRWIAVLGGMARLKREPA